MMVLALATLFLEPLPTQADNHISDTVHGHLGLWFRNRDSPNSRYTSHSRIWRYLAIQLFRQGRHSSTTIRAISRPKYSASSLTLTVNW